MSTGVEGDGVYRAGDRVRNEEWLTRLEEAADRLGLGTDARSRARDLFLSSVPEADRSKEAVVAASLYAATLLEGDRRSQSAVADAVGVSRLTVQRRWKELVSAAGLEPPDW